MAKVQNEMATRITIDTVQAANSMQALRQAVSANTNSWKAMEASLKSVGDYQGAADERVKGLSQSIELQKQRISELRERQQGLDQSTQQGAQQFVKLENQISQANRQMASYEAQLSRAKSSSEYYASGLANLQHQYKLNASASKAYQERLIASGRTEDAQREKLNSLKSSLENLAKQQSATKKLADEAAESEGKNSNLYRRRITDYNKVSASLSKASKQYDELRAAEIRAANVSTGGLDKMRARFLGVYSAEKQATTQAKTMGDVMKGSFLGTFASNLAQNAIMAITGKMHGLIAAGKQYNTEQDTMKTVWHSLTTQAPRDGQQMLDFINKLSQQSIYSADTINKMAQSFYHVDSSVKNAKTWTNDFVRLGSTMHMTNDQIAEAGEQFSKIVAGGKASQEDMNVMINRFPMFGEAIQKVTGKSMEQLQQLSQQGKLTSKDFVKAMDYLGNKYKSGQAEAMTSYMGMSMYLKSRFSKLAGDVEQSNFRMSKSAKNAMVQVTSDHAMEQYAKAISSALAGLAGALSKTIVWIHKHQTATKALISVTAGLVIFHKVAGWVTGFYGLIGRMIIAYKGYTKATDSAMVAQKMLNLAMKSNVILLIVSAIAGLVVALVQLYKHNKKFREFINGIASATKNGLKNVGKFFSNTWKSVTKGLSSFWSSTKKRFSNGWNDLSRATKSGSNSVTKWWDQTSTQTSRVAQNMFRQHKKTFESGYKVIQDRTNTWHDFVSGRWDRLGDDTKKTAKDMSNFQRRIFGDLYGWLNDKTNGRLGDMLKAWKDKLGSIRDVVSNARDAIHKRFVGLVRGIISPFNSMLDGLRKGINWILEKVGASGISGSWSIPMPSYATGTKDTHPGGLAIVNDGQTGHYREMYRLPNGQIGMFPATRNMIVPLPKGTSVLDGDSSYRLARILGQTPHYAGGIGSFFSGLLEKGKDILEDVDKILAHPIRFAEDVFKKFVNVKSSAKFAQDLIEHVPSYVAKQMGNWIKKQFEELADPGGSGVERWRPYVVKALATLHLSSSLVGKVLRQIQTESGGNPKAMGGTDGLADGHAEGLMQVKPGTFAANKLPGHGNIWNGFDNLLAGLNYARKRYGDSLSFLGQGHGYANGGLISNHGVYEIAEKNMPEYVIPTDINKRSRANQLLGEVITQFSSESKAMGNPLTGSSLASSESEIKTLNSKFDRLLSLVTELIGVNNDQVKAIQDQGSLDMQQLYKKEAKDARMRQLGF